MLVFRFWGFFLSGLIMPHDRHHDQDQNSLFYVFKNMRTVFLRHNKGSGHGLRWQWPFVYEATGRRGRDLSWQWSLFRLDLSLMGFGLGLVLDLMKHWPRSHVSWPPELNKFSCDTLNENKHVSGSNKKDGYRQLNVRQLDSLRPWDHRGKFYMDRKRGLVKRLAACNHLSSTISEI